MTKKTVRANEITERAKLAARTKAFTATKGELRRGWEAVTPELIEDIRVRDEEIIADYTEQLRAGIL